MQYVVFDIGTLVFGISPEGSTLSVRSADRVLLGSAHIGQGISRRECAFRLLDDVLNRGVLPTRNQSKVAFYNPHTGETALGATPRTAVLSADYLLELPLAGMDAVLEGDDLVLSSGVRLTPVEASPQLLVAAFEAHR